MATRARPQLGTRRRTVVPKAPRVVADTLKQDILNGKVGAGETLPAPDLLLERFGVSRPTLREAFALLESEGLVRLKPGPGGGAIVQALDSSAILRSLSDLLRFQNTTLAQLLEVRLILEPMGARLAAQRATDTELESLAQSLRRQEQTLDDEEAWIEENLFFHAAVAGAAHNPPLRVFADALGALIFKSGREAKMSTADRRRSLEQHAAVAEALAARDPDRAEHLLRDHLSNSIYVRKHLVAPLDWSASRQNGW
jgi:DNA-binding FadR family transcriptional regulator